MAADPDPTPADHTAPPTDHAAPLADHTAPRTGHAAPRTGHAAPLADHTAPRTGHAAPPADHTAPPTGHAAPPAGHAPSPADHASERPPGDRAAPRDPAGDHPAGDRSLAARLTGGRGLAYTVVGVLVFAGLALWLGTRPWLVELVARPDPLPAERLTRSGADTTGWLNPSAVVAMAGAGALLATRGLGRRLVGALLVLAGLGVLAASGYGLDADGAARVLLPAGNALSGLALCAAGAATLRFGAGWPTMGARYERGTERKDDMWSALDRGEDPTRPDGHHLS